MAAGLVLAALVAMATGRVDPLLSVLVVLILAGILVACLVTVSGVAYLLLSS